MIKSKIKIGEIFKMNKSDITNLITVLIMAYGYSNEMRQFLWLDFCS